MKYMHLKMITAISQHLRSLGRNGRHVEVVQGRPIGCADSDGIVDGSGGANGRRKGGKSLLKQALNQPQRSHQSCCKDPGIPCVSVRKGSLEHRAQFHSLMPRLITCLNDRELICP
jgi:hypothetical protein